MPTKNPTVDAWQILAEHFPASVIAMVKAKGCKVVMLREGQRYAAVSPELRRLGVDVDSWRVPPAGLFVVDEKTVYLRSMSRMTIVHEFGHAIDCALGEGGRYYSARTPEIRRAFSDARGFVTPYAASGIDEYFAESVRAFVGGANDGLKGWPDATPERLLAVDPQMYGIIESLFAKIHQKAAAPSGTQTTLFAA